VLTNIYKLLILETVYLLLILFASLPAAYCSTAQVSDTTGDTICATAGHKNSLSRNTAHKKTVPHSVFQRRETDRFGVHSSVSI